METLREDTIINLIISETAGTNKTTETQRTGIRTDAGEWERLHTLHSGGCGFDGALLPV